MFGSLYLSEREEDLTFGLKPEGAHPSRLLDIYFRPFREVYLFLKRRIRWLRDKLSSEDVGDKVQDQNT